MFLAFGYRKSDFRPCLNISCSFMDAKYGRSVISCAYFNDPFCIETVQRRMGKLISQMERIWKIHSSRGLTEVLSWHVHWETEENTKNTIENSRYPSRAFP
jgi:hypothetical protein